MARYITRVELHDATGQDYETLHTVMEKQGFSRFIDGTDKCWYQLPPAEYHRVVDLQLADVFESARKAVAAINKTFGIVVIEASNVMWDGFPKVQTPR